MGQTDKAFRRELARGHQAEDWLANVLRACDLPVWTPPHRCRPDGGNPDEFTDGGEDIVVGSKLVQAKRRDFNFDGLHDFPYPTAIVDADDARFHDADFFVLVNDALTGAIGVDVAASRHAWRRERKPDRKRGIVRTFITCPLAFCITLDETIERLSAFVRAIPF